ncbi:MAG: hypothetical protein AMXMBFR84_11350 [Candidatus Hydrogenedentota bacterium]
MNDMEDRLRQRALCSPSDQLDRRVEALLLKSAIGRQRMHGSRVTLRAMLGACAVCLALGFGAATWLYRGQQATPSREIIYIVQETQGSANVFDLPARFQSTDKPRRNRAYVIELEEPEQPNQERSPST